MSPNLTASEIAGCVCLVGLTQNCHLQLASPVTLSKNLTSPLTDYPDPGVAVTPYLFHITLFSMTNSFKEPGTHSIV